MADVEYEVIGNIGKPQIYCRYIEDNFECSWNIAELVQLKMHSKKIWSDFYNRT